MQERMRTAVRPRINYHLGRGLHDEVWATSDAGGRAYGLLERLYATWGCGYMDGAGWIFAEGVLERVQHDTLEAGEAATTRLAVVARRGQYAGHVVVRVDATGMSIYLDSDGISSERELLQRFQTAYRVPEARLCPFYPEALREAGFPRDPALSRLLADLLLVRLGPLPASRLTVHPTDSRILVLSRDERRPLTSSQVINLLRCLHTQAWLEEQARREDLASYNRAMRTAGATWQRNAMGNEALWRCMVSLDEEAGLRIRSHTLSHPGLVEVEAASSALAARVRRALEAQPALQVIW